MRLWQWGGAVARCVGRGARVCGCGVRTTYRGCRRCGLRIRNAFWAGLTRRAEWAEQKLLRDLQRQIARETQQHTDEAADWQREQERLASRVRMLEEQVASLVEITEMAREKIASWTAIFSREKAEATTLPRGEGYEGE